MANILVGIGEILAQNSILACVIGGVLLGGIGIQRCAEAWRDRAHRKALNSLVTALFGVALLGGAAGVWLERRSGPNHGPVAGPSQSPVVQVSPSVVVPPGSPTPVSAVTLGCPVDPNCASKDHDLAVAGTVPVPVDRSKRLVLFVRGEDTKWYPRQDEVRPADDGTWSGSVGIGPQKSAPNRNLKHRICLYAGTAEALKALADLPANPVLDSVPAGWTEVRCVDATRLK